MLRGLAVRRCVLPFTIATASCTSAFRVTKQPSDQEKKPAGLPFFRKSMIYRQHTTYDYSWLRVSLAVAPVLPPAPGGTERTGPATTLTRDVLNTSANRLLIEAVQRRVAGLPTVPVAHLKPAVDTIIAAFGAIPPVAADHLKAPTLLRPTSNFVERALIVDYTTIYYLNGKIPPFGSNNIAAELAPDGTLAKGSAQATGGVGEAITAIAGAVTGLAPVKEVLSAKWLPTTKNDSSDVRMGITATLIDPTTLSFRVELSTESRSVSFDFTKDTPKPPNGEALQHVPADFTTGIFTSRASDTPPPKPAEDGITFSGKVQVPEPKKP